MAAFVPLTFAAGEAYQFDWSEEEVEIGGVVQRVKAAHFRLTHSRQPFVMVFPRETQEMVFAAHYAAFHYWGGVITTKPLRPIRCWCWSCRLRGCGAPSPWPVS